MFYYTQKKHLLRTAVVLGLLTIINPSSVSAQLDNTAPVTSAVPYVSDSLYNVPKETQILHSGNFDYQIVNEAAKQIALRKISNYGEEVVFPSEIDGYQVYQIGADEMNSYGLLDNNVNGNDNRISSVFASGTENIKKITIPEGIRHIGYGAIDNVQALTAIEFPSTLQTINGNFLNNSTAINTIEFKSGINILGSAFTDVSLDKVIVKDKFYIDEDAGFAKEINTILVKASDNTDTSINMHELKVNDIIVEKGVKSIFVGDVIVNNNLYCMDKNTKLSCYAELVNMVVTVKDSVAMKYCKNHKINYSYNNIPQIDKVNIKTKGKKNIYTWRQVKPVNRICRYDKENKKCKISNKSLKFIYEIKGKTANSKKYSLMKKTKKTKWSTTKKVKIRVEAVLVNKGNILD